MHPLARAAAVIALIGTFAAPAIADPGSACTPAEGTIETQVSTGPCASPIGLCRTGAITGTLSGTTMFVVDSVQVLGNGAALRFTGTLTITTEEGTVTAAQAGIVNLRAGIFTEHGEITGGTGAFSEARGELNFHGAAGPAATAFTGRVTGVVCSPR